MPFLLHHEFLFLLCNSEDRLALINRVHNPKLVSLKGDVHNFEMLDRRATATGRRQNKHLVTHIHLLDEKAFKNEAPHVLVGEQLEKDMEDRNIRYVGVKKTADDIIAE